MLFSKVTLAMSSGKVLIYGGRGALGSTILDHFKANNYWTLSIDLVANDNADANVVVDPSLDWVQQEAAILSGVASSIDSPVDAILCVAGGWAGGNAAADDTVKNCDLMWKQSVWSSVIAARLASKHLKQGGLLQLTGAAPAVAGTAGMIGYGMAKAAVHQLTASLAQDNSGLPSGAVTVAVLPITLDTPMNRKWMPKADHSTWTPMTWIASTFLDWTKGNSRPASGSLLKLETKGGETQIIPVTH